MTPERMKILVCLWFGAILVLIGIWLLRFTESWHKGNKTKDRNAMKAWAFATIASGVAFIIPWVVFKYRLFAFSDLNQLYLYGGLSGVVILIWWSAVKYMTALK